VQELEESQARAAAELRLQAARKAQQVTASRHGTAHLLAAERQRADRAVAAAAAAVAGREAIVGQIRAVELRLAAALQAESAGGGPANEAGDDSWQRGHGRATAALAVAALSELARRLEDGAEGVVPRQASPSVGSTGSSSSRRVWQNDSLYLGSGHGVGVYHRQQQRNQPSPSKVVQRRGHIHSAYVPCWPCLTGPA
jgi:hypothetical protein